jgi:hypothetical protein
MILICIRFIAAVVGLATTDRRGVLRHEVAIIMREDRNENYLTSASSTIAAECVDELG